MKRITLAALLVAMACPAQAPHPKVDAQDLSYRTARDRMYQWRDWQFLMGTWGGTGKGFAGEGPGQFTFKQDLDGKVLVFTSQQQFAAQAGKPEFTYRSIVYVYLYGLKQRADLFDNEGHFLTFNVSVSSSPAKVVMTSTEGAAGFPRFRFTYAQQANDRLAIDFQIAQAATSQRFTSYIAGTVQKQP